MSKTIDLVKQVDWDCEVKTLFQKKNLGCGIGPVTAINWFLILLKKGLYWRTIACQTNHFFIFAKNF